MQRKPESLSWKPPFSCAWSGTVYYPGVTRLQLKCDYRDRGGCVWDTLSSGKYLGPKSEPPLECISSKDISGHSLSNLNHMLKFRFGLHKKPRIHTRNNEHVAGYWRSNFRPHLKEVDNKGRRQKGLFVKAVMSEDPTKHRGVSFPLKISSPDLTGCHYGPDLSRRSCWRISDCSL